MISVLGEINRFVVSTSTMPRKRNPTTRSVTLPDAGFRSNTNGRLRDIIPTRVISS